MLTILLCATTAILLVGVIFTTTDATYTGRVWTYQSTNRVDAMGMGYGTSYAMIGRGRHDIATGKQDIYKTTNAAGTVIDLPAAVWIGSCVWENDPDFVRCVGRKSPIYNINTNKPICTADPNAEVFLPDVYCENPFEHLYKAPYDPADPSKRADFTGDKYGAYLTLAGDLETGRLMAVGAPKTYDADGTPYLTPNTFYDTYGAVYTYTGEYKHWTENQRLTADDSNVQLTDNIPDYGTRVEIDRVTSRTMLVTCPQCVVVDRAQGSVYVYTTEEGKYWSNTQQLTCDDATTDTWEFGKNMRIYDEFALLSAAALNHRGASYIFRQERHSKYKGGVYNGLWTQQQRLRPNDAYIRSSGSLYGEKMDLHGKTLVITQNIQKTHGINSGVAYVYESHKTLEYPDLDWVDTSKSSDDDHRRQLHPKPKPVPMHKWWTQVQKLYPSDPHEYRLFGDEVSIWGDVISIMAGGEGLTATDWSNPGELTYQFGSVYMFSRSRSDVNVWTQQQKLYNPDANDGTFFSESVDDSYQNYNLIALKDNRFGLPRLHGTTMMVTSSSQHGYMMTDTNIWNCLVITVSDGMGDGWDKARLVATAPTDPLRREVKHDTYSQYCDAYNYEKNDETKPLSRKLKEQYRYCPLSAEDEGDYVFEVMGNPRGKKGNKGTPSDDLYWREIYWEIYNEFDKKRYMGDAHTKMTFNWGKLDFFFTDTKIEREFKPPSVCKQCNWRKGPKPKKPRALKASSVDEDHVTRRLNLYPTPSPTTSLSPTLPWDTAKITDQWMFYMGRQTSPAYGSTTTWFDDNQNGTGTHFYIYDSNGQNITEPLVWGQLCEMTGTIADSCEIQDLPVGGTYTLRVTGALDYRRNDIQWKFCNIAGTAQQTLVFSVYSTTCLPIALYDSDSICEKNGFQVKTDTVAVLKGLVGLYSEARDTAIVKEAFENMFQPFVASSIEVFIEEENLYSASTLDDVQLRVRATFDSAENNINVQSLDGIHNFETSLVQKLSYFDEQNLIPSLLSSAASNLLSGDTHNIMSGSSVETHISSVQVVAAEPNGLTGLIHEQVHGNTERSGDTSAEGSLDASDAVEKSQMDRSTRLEYNILNAEAIGGYVVMGCALAAVVVVVLVSWHQNYKQQRKARTTTRGGLSRPEDLTASLSGV
mmetsp:Transcript_33945/g.63345  ORF Transcript_33945/g.63345 Transcript_33945/m.63345 type:complete len:1151 (+) Transcript_33945:39-3491(+)